MYSSFFLAMIIMWCHTLVCDVKCNNFSGRFSHAYLLFVCWLFHLVLGCTGHIFAEWWRKCRHDSMISSTGDHTAVVLHTCFCVMIGLTLVASSSTMISVIDQLVTSCVWSFVCWLNVIHNDLRLGCKNAIFWSIGDLFKYKSTLNRDVWRY